MTQHTRKNRTVSTLSKNAHRSRRWRRVVLSLLIATTSTGNMAPLLAGDPSLPVYIANKADVSQLISTAEVVQPTVFALVEDKTEDKTNKPSAKGKTNVAGAPSKSEITNLNPQVTSSLTADPRPIAYISLTEARARVLNSNPQLDALSAALAAVSENVTIADSLFDGQVGLDIQGGKLDRQLPTSVGTFGSTDTDLQTDFLRSLSGNMLSYSQRTRTGGEFLLGYNNDYQFLDPAGSAVLVNPAWDADLNFRYSQRLLQGRRRVVNEAPIRLAQMIYSSQSSELRGIINRNFRDVEVAYWNYAGLYKELEAVRESTARFKVLVDSEKARLEAKQSTLVNVAQADTLYQTQRVAELELKRLTDVAAVELLRLMGNPQGTTVQLVPTDLPQLHSQLNVDEGMIQSGFRPELEAQRMVIRQAKLQVLQARDLIRPDLRANFGYTLNGLDSRLDDALDTVTTANYQDFFVGFEFRQFVGRRAAYARARQACQLFASESARLDAFRRDIFAEVQTAAANVAVLEASLAVQAERLEAALAQSKGRRDIYAEKKTDIDLLLRADQSLIESEREAIRAAYAYQQSLSRYRYATGTIDQFALGLNPTLEGSLESFNEMPVPMDAVELPPAPPKPSDSKEKAEAKTQNAPKPVEVKPEAPKPEAPKPVEVKPAVENPAKVVPDAKAQSSQAPANEFAPVVSTPYVPSWISQPSSEGPLETYPQVVVEKIPTDPKPAEVSVPSKDKELSWSDIFEPAAMLPSPDYSASTPAVPNPSGLAYPEVVVADLNQAKPKATSDQVKPQVEQPLPKVHVSPLKFER